MPEIPDVVLNEVIDEDWGNAIRDRTLQRYADLTERTAEHGTPTAGDLSFIEATGDLDVYFSGSWRHIGAPVGSLMPHAGGSVPTGWRTCDGSAVSRTTYAALFAQIGTTWGAGDGSTTFNVPDFRGRYMRGVAAAGTGDAVGETFGSDLIVDHTHPADPPSTNSGAATASGTGGPSVTGAPSDPSHRHAVDIASFNTGAVSGTNPEQLPASAAVNILIRT